MATSTDMKGNVVKMEVDYSDTVDKRIPECEKLATVSNLCFHPIFLPLGIFFKTVLCGTCCFAVARFFSVENMTNVQSRCFHLLGWKTQ